MPIDPNIALSVRPVADPMEQVGKAMSLRALAQQGQLQQMQMQQAEQDQRDQMTLRDLYARNANDPAELLKNVRGAGLYKQADALEKSDLERRKLSTETAKATAETQRAQAETQLKHLDYKKQMMTGLLADPSDDAIASVLGSFVQQGMSRPEDAQAEFAKIQKMPLGMRREYLQFVLAKQDQAIGMLTPKLEALDMGGTRQVVDMNPRTNPGALGATYQKTQTPDSVASVGATIRGQNMTDARAREATEQGKVPPGYQRLPDGSLQPMKGGPADPGAKQAAAAGKILPLLDEAEKLLGNATGSYLGAGYDAVAQGFGVATKGAQATAQLKALEGALMMAQPRMEGPQSDKDVALYRQMAGQIGDSTVPVESRRAAINTIRELQLKYSPGVASAVSQRVSSGKISPLAPKIGSVEDGFIYLGGDAGDPKSWKPVGSKK